MHFIEANCKTGMDQNVIAVILSPCELILVDSSLTYVHFTTMNFFSISDPFSTLVSLYTTDIKTFFLELNDSNKKPWVFS